MAVARVLWSSWNRQPKSQSDMCVVYTIIPTWLNLCTDKSLHWSTFHLRRLHFIFHKIANDFVALHPKSLVYIHSPLNRLTLYDSKTNPDVKDFYKYSFYHITFTQCHSFRHVYCFRISVLFLHFTAAVTVPFLTTLLKHRLWFILSKIRQLYTL